MRELRRLVLQSAGYEVVSPDTVEEGMKVIAAGRCDCLVLGHTLTEAECESLTARARSVPNLKVVQLMRAYAPMPELKADASVDALAGPAVLLETIREVLERPGQRRAPETPAKKSRNCQTQERSRYSTR